MKKKRWIWWICFSLLLSIFVFSVFKLLNYKNIENESKEAINKLTKIAVTVRDKNEKETIKAPISVDFYKLKQENNDIVAWLYSEDTPINYPVMCSKDNNDYLRTIPNGKYNVAGSLFLDCRCTTDFSDKVNIIYGHNMKNDTMFGTLPDYKNKVYFAEHKVIYLFTPTDNYKLTALEGFVVKDDDEIYSLSEEMEYKTVYLSTCSYEFNNARYVLKCMAEKID